MENGKNVISNSSINTAGGDFINGDNNFIQKIVIQHENRKEKLTGIIEQTKNVLNKIQSDISGLKMDRNLSEIPYKQLISENQFVFIEGAAGSGKSSFAKQLLESLDDTCIISFAADQLIQNSLIHTLRNIQVDLSIQEIFIEFKEFSNKLIYIDSFEKLLEGDAEAFRELISILKSDREIKLVLSCRSYALEILKFNYFDQQLLQNNATTIHVPQFTDLELDYFLKNIPVLNKVILNKELIAIVKTPKYLALAVKLITLSNSDLSNMGIVEFKKNLWKIIVGGNNGFLAEKRQETFINIAVKRAKNLTLLTSVREYDSEVVHTLKDEGVLYEENGFYAPSHDIFEDWGLVRYVDILKNENPKIEHFFDVLSNEPAIRRGFRLWAESKIEESESWIYNFITETINSNSIDSHWKDEVLTGIVKSELCDKFFSDFKDELLEDNLKLFKKVIHLLRISGKDFNQSPNNIGWDVVIKFIYENLDKVHDMNTQILRFIYDWQNILYYGSIKNTDTPKFAGKIVFSILNDFEEGVDWMNEGESSSLTDKGIKLLYQLTEYIPEEIKSILDSLLSKRGEKNNYKLRDKRKKKTKYALSHFHSGTLPKFFPDELIALANRKWKLKETGSEEELFRRRSSYGIEHYFGITDKFDYDYFPQSAYQTFLYKLFKSHPNKALAFVIEFTNHAAKKYVESEFLKDEGFGRKEDEVFDIEIMYNGIQYTILGSNYLWSINRGGQITVPSLLQSIVVAFEKYMYDLGSLKSDKADEILQSFFSETYTNSNSVILFSVLASITMAYPKNVGDKFLPLLSDKHFFKWDSHRWMQEHTAGMLLDFPNYSWEANYCDQERKDALKWEHRKKYYRGMIGFMIDYQLRHGNLDGRLLESIDYLESKHDKNDVYFLKLLTEIDGRRQVIEKVEHEGNTVLQISPNYSADTSLKQEMQRNESSELFRNELSKYSTWVVQTYQKKSEENKTYSFWKECYGYYQNVDKSKINPIEIFPCGTLAALGLDLFDDSLTINEFTFCIDTILELAHKFFDRQKNRDPFDLSDTKVIASIFDSESVYSSLPKLLSFKNKLSDAQLQNARVLVFYFLRDLHTSQDIHLNHLYRSYRDYMWIADYQFAYNCFVTLIRYGSLNKKYPPRRSYSHEELSERENDEREILDFLQNNELEYELSDLSYAMYSHWDLRKVVDIFPVSKEYNFSYPFLRLILSAHLESYTSEKYGRSEYYDTGAIIKRAIVEFLLEIPFNEEAGIFFELVINKGIHLKEGLNRYDAIKYLQEIVEGLYYKVDQNIDKPRMLKNLWNYWDLLYQKEKEVSPTVFNRQFLFSGNWKQEAEDWFVLRDTVNSESYMLQLNKLRYLSIEALIQLISGIGFESMMPYGIRILTKQLKSQADKISMVDFFYGEKLIMRCFKNKIKLIKEDSLLMEEFLWFLTIMIDQGSSKAYYIRENIILYKDK